MPRRKVVRPSRWTLAAESCLISLMFGVPLALGGAPRWVLFPVVVLSFGALIASVKATSDERVAIPGFAWLLLFGAIFCMFQLVPLPNAELALLSPAAAELRDFALVPLGIDASQPISLDAPSTAREVAKHLSYAAVLIAAARVCAARKSRRRLLAGLATSGTLLALIGYAHRLVGATQLFGLFAFQQAQPPLLTPFGNPNHLAGFLILGASLALGLAIRTEDRQSAWLWGLAYAAQGVAVLLSLSRAGIAAFLASQLLLVGWVMIVRERSGERRDKGAKVDPDVVMRRFRRAAIGMIALAVVMAVAAFLAVDALAKEWASADSLEKLRASKIGAWPSMAQAALTYARAGMGRGAFEVGYGRFQTLELETIFSHAENFVLQLAAEWGLAGAAVVLAMAAWFFARLFRMQDRSPLDLACLAGLIGLVMQNTLDFSLELPACAVAGAVLLGALCRPGGPGGGDSVALSRGGLVPAAAGFGVLATVMLWLGRSDPRADERTVAAATTVSEVKPLALEAIARHPADYMLYLLAGQTCANGGEPHAALAFVNRALYLRPVDSSAHLIAARSLMRIGARDQGFLEYRLASSSGSGLALPEAIARVRTFEELDSLAAEPAKAVAEAASMIWSRRPKLALELIDRRLPLLPETEAGPLWLALSTFRQSQGDADGASEALEHAERLMPDDSRPAITRAALVAKSGKPDKAAQLLEARLTQKPGQLEVWLALAQLQIDYGDPRAGLEVLRKAGPYVDSPGERSAVLQVRSDAYRKLGRLSSALDALRSAARLQPDAAWLQYSVARMCEDMGRLEDAVEAIQAGMSHDSQDGRDKARDWIAKIERQEADLRAREEERAPHDPLAQPDSLPPE